MSISFSYSFVVIFCAFLLQLSDPDMDYKLNPDAKEFVPVHSPTLETFPTSTTPLSPNAPNFEPLAEPNSALSTDVFGVNNFEGENQTMEFPDQLNPFGLNSAPIPAENLQMTSPSFGMAETPSYAVLENIGLQETPLATPQIPEATPWSAEPAQMQDPMDFIEEQFKEPVLDAAPVAVIKDDLGMMFGNLNEIPQSPLKEAASPDFMMQAPAPLSPAKEELSAPFVLEDMPVSQANFDAPMPPFQEHLVASPVSEERSSPFVLEQHTSPVFEEQFVAETQQPDLIESLPQQIVDPEPEKVKDESPVLDDILPVEKMIEEDSVISPPVTSVVQPEPEPSIQVEEPKAVDSICEAAASLKIDTPEEPKVKIKTKNKLSKLYRRKKIKGRF